MKEFSYEKEKSQPMPQKLLRAYWNMCMQTRRMNEENEAERMLAVLKGTFLERGSPDDCYDDLLGFWACAKRPYGSKDVEASICFHLGWDPERQLCFNMVPPRMRKAAERIHKIVGILLAEEIERHKRYALMERME
jgi:hypothetical protein